MKRLWLVLGLVVGCSSAGATDGEGAGGGGSSGTPGLGGAAGEGSGEGGAAGSVQLAGSGGSDAGTGGGAGSVNLGGSGGGSSVTQCADGQSEQEVYGHSALELFRVDAATKQVTKVGNLNCGSFFPEQVIDLAINKEGQIYGTTSSSLVTIDKKTAACTVVSSGSYPNSLSFVPAGTIYPDKEALVGYQGSTYVLIDPKSGDVTPKGSLAGGYTSSGDIVSVIGGGTYLTVKGNGCGDCLVQVDPVSGDIVKNLGDVGYSDVYGLAFWANEVYGFTDGGKMFTFDLATNQATNVAIPNAPSGLSFYGAGSSTCARLDPIIID